MIQQSILVNLPHISKMTDEYFFNYAFNDRDILRSIMIIHNCGEPIEADVCYSTGNMWQGLPKPRIKFDLHPQLDGVDQANFENLPLEDNTIESIVCDPPFLIRTGEGSKIKNRFSDYPSYDALKMSYKAALNEFWRVLTPRRGIVAFKCQGLISSGKQNFTPEWVHSCAIDIGFYPLDKYYKINKNPMKDSRKQRHARRAVSTWWIFRKDSKNA